MATRDRYSNLSTPPVFGPDLLQNLAGHIDTFYDAACFPLTSIGGTGDAVTATLDPALDAGGFADGMRFTITWGAANTGAVTLAINGGSALPVVDKSGDALVGGALASGLRSMIEYLGGSFRMLTEPASTGSGGVAASYQAFTSSGTWNKPAGIADDQIVMVELWGGGGGGSRSGGTSSGGGGGGGYARAMFRAVDLPSSVSVTIGAGGLGRTGSQGDGAAGGNTTFGSLLTAFGGGAAQVATGGGGGTPWAAGVAGAAGGNAASIYHGGGGASGSGTPAGGNAMHGGGGGGGGSGGAGGVSVHGGNGGAAGDGTPTATAGSAPGGGGGGGANVDGANGGRGECRVTIFAA